METLLKEQRLRNSFQIPLTSKRDSDSKKFLGRFVDGVERWKSQMKTFIPLSHLCRALLEIAKYCLEELGAKYMLPEKF